MTASWAIFVWEILVVTAADKKKIAVLTSFAKTITVKIHVQTMSIRAGRTHFVQWLKEKLYVHAQKA